MHIKDFNHWSTYKKILDESIRPICGVREVRWCSLGHNVGSEIDGKGSAYTRPVVILKFTSNNTCFCVPLTTSEKQGKFMYDFTFQGQKISARLDQVRIVDVKRMKDRLGKLSQKDFNDLNEKVRKFIFN
jgi:mRNA interferase MazF